MRLPAKGWKAARQAGSFVWLQRWVTPDAAERVRRLSLPGIHLHSERRRFYPNGSLGGPILGFADRDGRGLSGVELLFDRELRGAGAELQAKRDGGGRVLPTATRRQKRAPASQLALDRAAAPPRRRSPSRCARPRAPRDAGRVDPTGEITRWPSRRARSELEDSSAYRARAFVDTFEPGGTPSRSRSRSR
jgi:hypothetical protein